MSHPLAALKAELGCWAESGHIARIWIRDDDAVAASPALDLFLETLARFRAPALIAAIPSLIEPSLCERLANEERIAVGVHGWAHQNHADTGMKAAEYPACRDRNAMLRELHDGLAVITALFPRLALAAFVPPWNRAYEGIAGDLAALGYVGLSTFAREHLSDARSGFRVVNCNVDPMRWRGARGGRSLSEVTEELVIALAASRATDHRPVGLLTHHLVHDAQAQTTLTALLDALAEHSSAAWIEPHEVFSAA